MSVLTSRKLLRFTRYAAPSYLANRLEKASYTYGFVSAERLTLPDFLCVGFRKTGTTWLYENLYLHPDIYLPPYKNVRYFSNDFYEPLESYARHFKAGEDKLKGDFSNSYSFIAKGRVRFVRTVMPDAKLIFLLRNPVERAWSEFVHNATEQERPIDDFSADEVGAIFAKDPVIKAGGYTAILDKWLSVFPREQVFVGFYDDLAAQPRELLTDIFEFLGVTTDVAWSTFPYHETIIPPAGRAYKHHNSWRGVIAPEHQNSADLLRGELEAQLHTLLRPELLKLRGRFGEKVEHWI
jgi:hypothetical protein